MRNTSLMNFETNKFDNSCIESQESQRVQKNIKKVYIIIVQAQRLQYPNMQQQYEKHLQHLLNLPQSEMQSHIQTLSAFPQIVKQIKQSIVGQKQQYLTVNKIYVLEAVCQADTDIDLDSVKNVKNVYIFVAFVRAYLSRWKDKVRGLFTRGLKKQSVFWGVGSIQRIHECLKNRTFPQLVPCAPIQTRYHTLSYLHNNPQLIPQSYPIHNYIFKHMLLLRPSTVPSELPLYTLLENMLFQYKYWFQVLEKNCKFVLEFFKKQYTEKQLVYFPADVFRKIIWKMQQKQIDRMLKIAVLGEVWTQAEVCNCIGHVFRLGITETSYKILKSLIQMLKQIKKYSELITSYQRNLPKVFIFLKYTSVLVRFPKLYEPSLKTLSQLILGPYKSGVLYNIFTTKMLQFLKPINLKQKHNQFKDLIFLIQCVVAKYKEDYQVAELEAAISIISNKDENNEDKEKQKLRKEIAKFDWKVFEKAKDQQTGSSSVESGEDYRGIINIGNSCYMNSFLQCLYMTKQYRRKVLQSSTLALQKQILTKLQSLHSPTPSSAPPSSTPSPSLNLALQARETVRPLAELQRTFSLLKKSKRPSISPANIKKISPPEFHNCNQHDAIQFGRFLIDAIAKSIQEVFYGKSVTQIECPFCGKVRGVREEFLDFMVGFQGQEETEIVDESKKIPNQTKQQQKENQQKQSKIENIKQNQQNQTNTMQNQTKMQEQNNVKSQVNTETQNIKYKDELGEMIKQSLKDEYLQGLVCSSCNNSQMQSVGSKNISIKRHYITKAPTYLVLTMKRFEYSKKQNKNIKKSDYINLHQYFNVPVLQQMQVNKNIQKIQAQQQAQNNLNNLDKQNKQKQEQMATQPQISTQMQPETRVLDVQYCIYAIIVHRGSSANSGHYYVFSKSSMNPTDQSWLCFNDTIVTKLQNFQKVKQFLYSNIDDTPYIIFSIRKQYMLQNHLKIEQNYILRPPLQAYIDKDDGDYIREMSKSNNGKIDLSLLKFNTGSFYRSRDFDKDKDQDGSGGFGGFGGPNNYIM